jgi:hypothetical protein
MSWQNGGELLESFRRLRVEPRPMCGSGHWTSTLERTGPDLPPTVAVAFDFPQCFWSRFPIS